MHINVSQPLSHKAIIIYKLHNFFMLCMDYHGKHMKERKYFRAIFQIPAGNLTDYEWMANNMTVIEQSFKPHVSLAEMGYPDGCVGKNHTNYPLIACGGPALGFFPFLQAWQASFRFPSQSMPQVPVLQGKFFPEYRSVFLPS